MTTDELKAEYRILLMRNARLLDERQGIPPDHLLDQLAAITLDYAASRVASPPNRKNVTKITEKVPAGAGE